LRLHARLMSQALRKLNGVVSRTGTTLIFINQLGRIWMCAGLLGVPEG
jgi:RecA/RadA recombinase